MHVHTLLKVPIFLSVQDCMKGPLARARVVYAPVEEIGSENRLSRACRILFSQVIVFFFLSFLHLKIEKTIIMFPVFIELKVLFCCVNILF